LRRAENEFELRIKKIRSDNGTEFKNSQIEGFLEDEGIKHEFSSPYTPQQNGIVERKNRTLLDMARTMLDEYKTPDRFWAEAINTACYSINRLYLHRILKKTSYKLLTEQVDLDELDDEEAPCIVLRNMSIGDVCPKESKEPPQAQDQPSSSNQASPPTQDEDQA
jgi:transposase InsO family protein